MEVSGKRADNSDDAASGGTLCELCESDNISKASGYCRECEEYMCNACFKHHRKAKLCRDHTLLDIDVLSETSFQRNTSATKCKQHETETVKYYCRTHEAVGCGDCLVSKHSGCKTDFIKDLSDNLQQSEDYKTFMKKLENQIHETNEFEKNVQASKNDNKLMFEKALRDIKQFRLEINKYLDKVETDITCQVKSVLEENDTLLAKLETDCMMFSAKLEEITDMLNSEQYKDTVLFIHMVECKSKAPECEKTISDMKTKSMKKYEFVGDQQLQSFVTSSQKLGTLAISNLVVFPKTNEPVSEQIEPSLAIVEPVRNLVEHKSTNAFSTSKENDSKKYTEEIAAMEGRRKRRGRRLSQSLKSQVAVGARVESNDPFEACYHGNGTVTAVHEDGKVTVKWSNGHLRQHRVGVGDRDVTLI